jgi:alpha-amylase/alpha-mannosidase (GH57 family)
VTERQNQSIKNRSMQKFICVHGHFYQPPRENPWLESVELQDSATPYHDWNERIAAECYAPNATARILDGEGRIASIVNTYSRISFNFGPTLLAWMKQTMPEVHQAIVEADVRSRQKFSGHGSALAQVYNHMILPLANRRDKYTQVLWGIRDFEFRFGRRPEGMWLSETAADSETLDVLAELGIRFTILSPFQAKSVRELAAKDWKAVHGGCIDPSCAYLCKLPSGREINLFFYDAPVSKAIAFERLLESGERFAGRLLSAFSEHRHWDQLVHVATDGESYGHHHRSGEMALAYALHHIESNHLARLTNYAEYLAQHPPTHEAQIHEGSAWSCSHGVGRWMSNCGCNSGGHAGWHQDWRAPLRHALDWLRDQLVPLYEQKATALFKNPWDARNDYIDVILDRSPKSLGRFFEAHGHHPLNGVEQIAAVKLLEMQRHAMLMYTSCGWFFDEISGIETVQVIQYAARALQLARNVFEQDFEPGFLNLLQNARSNFPELKDGGVIYEKYVRPAVLDWEKVIAHYAMSSLFEAYEQQTHIYHYHFQSEQRQVHVAGKAKLAYGRVRVQFDIARESSTMTYAALYLGEQNVVCGVNPHSAAKAFEEATEAMRAAFEASDYAEVIRLIDHHLQSPSYNLKTLFKDEQRKIINEILTTARVDIESSYRLVTERYQPLMNFLRDLHIPPPEPLQTAAHFILHADACRALAADLPDLDRVRALLQKARTKQIDIFNAELAYVVKSTLERSMQKLSANPGDVNLLRHLAALAALVRATPLYLNLWKVQNAYWEMLQSDFAKFGPQAGQADPGATEWAKAFLALGEQLNFAVKHLGAAS